MRHEEPSGSYCRATPLQLFVRNPRFPAPPGSALPQDSISRRAAPPWLFVAMSCVLLLAGCNLTGQNTTPQGGPIGAASNDPLLGGGAPIPPGPGQGGNPPNRAGTANPQPATPVTSGPLPTFPAPSSPAGPALLAGGSLNRNPPTGGPDLRMSGAGATPAAGSAPGATLGQLPVAEGSFQRLTTGGTTNPGLTLTSGQSGTDFDKLQYELVTRRHVAYQKLEMLGGDPPSWKYSCSIPAGDPNYRNVIEARASSPTEAMRAAIDKIDRDLNK